MKKEDHHARKDKPNSEEKDWRKKVREGHSAARHHRAASVEEEIILDPVVQALLDDMNSLVKESSSVVINRMLGEFIRKHTTVDSKNHNGHTLVMLAALHGNRNLFSALIDHAADLNIRDKKKDGAALVHYAKVGGDAFIMSKVGGTDGKEADRAHMARIREFQAKQLPAAAMAL